MKHFVVEENLDLIDVIEKVKEKITDDSDMVWTRYHHAGQLRDELDGYIQQIKNGDTSVLENLKMLFLPSASLQEHAVSNGWSNEYLALAEKFDYLYWTLVGQV